ncbi:AAA family ATPase [uncultured Pelagimonas sp.]|uniref:AAA family ATPase n=1 Tax=uncultured Pelagimonas sp. TaxID=1618102 RepID=UPI0026201EB9|nr:AAA family ATPase [uncultured Pelagimonas sp.]
MTKIPFADIRFPADGSATLPSVETRLKEFLSKRRSDDEDISYIDTLTSQDLDRIRWRAKAYLDACKRHSGMGHLEPSDRELLEVLRDGVDLRMLENEHQADEIASALHVEMPWMAAATERVWKDLRASVRRGDPGVRLSPLLLVGPPGIGKSHWARLLGQHLSVPTTVVEATNEPASFVVNGTQRGWSSSQPGKPLQGILSHLVGNPVIVIDEIEKAGEVETTKGQTYSLTAGLLPLLERSTAKAWSCPYFRVTFDMSWISWVLTANSLTGLPQPFLSRCPPLELSALTLKDLQGFAVREGARRQLPLGAVEAVQDVVEAIKQPQLLSLRNVMRMLDAVEHSIHAPVLH